MKRISIAAALVVIALCATVFIWHKSRGCAVFEVRDVTKAAEFRVKAPVMPFRNGALFVRAEGHLNGNATLNILSNKGRDHRTGQLADNFGSKQYGGPEDWVDDLLVQYSPGTATEGQITLTLACGRNLPERR